MMGILDNPALQLFVITTVAVIIQNLLFKKLSDQAALRELKRQLDAAQVRMKEAQKENDAGKLDKALKSVNELSMKRLQSTMKPNLLSSAIFIFILGWVQKTYATLVVTAPIPLPVLHWKFPLIFFETSLGWFWWYFYVAIVGSIIFRDLFGIEV
jgi:uncharacterized membrane protein (DUF106 family)